MVGRSDTRVSSTGRRCRKRLRWLGLAAVLAVGLSVVGCGDDETGTGVTSQTDSGAADVGLDGSLTASDVSDVQQQRLSVCVLQDRGPTGRCADPSVVDFGSVSAETTAQRLVRVDNIGDTPVQVTDLNVGSDQFELTAVLYGPSDQDPNSLERTEASLPVERQPDESVYVEIAYTAGSTSGSLPADHIEIQANVDGASLFVAVPMVGEVLACEAGRGDCDGDPSNGCEANLAADDLNCGSCGASCDTESGTGTCVNGSCVVDQCTAPFADCNNMDADGCEVDTDTAVDHCGACETPCAPPHATAACDAGACTIGACDEGFADCNGDPTDGCEVNLANDAAHCGSCDETCDATGATPVCIDSECTLGVCTGEFENCDNNNENGCEVNLDTDTENCGACDNECTNNHGSTLCSKSACVPTCVGMWDNCDQNPDNGCEQSLSQLDSCGACGQICDLPNAVQSCSTGTCELVRCETGFADCNGDPTDGCEVNTNTSVDNCGACGATCSNEHGSKICDRGTCAPTCQGLWGDCDSDLTNGCEQSLSALDSCGTCGTQCALPNAAQSCGAGSCTLDRCEPDFANCDNTPSNGCEVSTATDPDNCGGCGQLCTNNHGSQSCADGTCSPSCDLGYDSCDGDPTNGCETPLNTLDNCGQCGQVCDLAHASESCSSSSCQLTQCEPGWQDCDGDPTNGCEVNLNTSTSNCGACGNACTNPNGSASCSSGACIPNCASGYDNCDGNPTNGCETSLSTLDNCGACGSVCSIPHASQSCSSGTCQVGGSCQSGYASCDGNQGTGCETRIATDRNNCGACGTRCLNGHGSTYCVSGSCSPTCNNGYDDCDGSAQNGCETNIDADANNCGACGNTCNLDNATAMCSNGGCAIATCDPGFVDCNGDPADGCEVDVMTDESNCGACGNTCSNSHGSTFCSSGSCSPTCNTDFDDCNGDADDGCETSLTTLSDCGSCGNACNLSDASETCGSGSCEIDRCARNQCNLNGYSFDGCEHDLDQYSYCSSNANSLGSVSGDEGGTKTASNSGNKWYKVRVTEDRRSEEDPSVRIDLVPPPGADYDLEAHCAGCSGTSRSSRAGGDATETIRFKWEDEQSLFGGSDDSHTVYIHVEPFDVRTCGDWTLEVEGDPSNEGSKTGCSG